MNPFIFSFVALCLTQGAIAQYQTGGSSSYGAGHSSGGYQRKMSPSPQSYGMQQSSYGQSAGYQQAAAAPAYHQQQQSSAYEASSSYEQPQQSYAQRAPSSASVSTYDERTPAASSGYGKAAAAAAPSYNRHQSSYQQAAPAYQQQQQSYAKAAPKYEEPQHPPMPFAWGYDINDGYGGAQYHKESGDEYGKRTGSYGYTDAYGIYRQVDYVADEHGFRATIKTNEPGTANESPADVELHAYEPPSNYYAGNTNSYGASSNSYGASSNKQSGSYGAAPAQTYSRPAAQSASYGRSSSYKAAAAAPQQSYARPAGQAYGEQAQYSSSAIVPVYQKVAAKKY